MSSVIIAGNTSGSVTLAAPDVAGTTTLTLPATSGTVLTTTGGVAPSTSGNVLTSNGTTWTSAAASGVGVGQTWTVFTVGTTRISGTTYTNSTGKPITILLQFNESSAATLTVNGATAIAFAGFAYVATMTAIIPTGATYSFTAPSGIYAWAELR